MSKETQLSNEMRNRKLFRLGSPLNVVNIGKGSDEHEFAKFFICLKLKKEGHKFLTEAEFKGGRADVVDLTDGVCIEVVHTESEESIKSKESRYPLPVVVFKVNTTAGFLEGFKGGAGA
jgi:hypothetical protein